MFASDDEDDFLSKLKTVQKGLGNIKDGQNITVDRPENEKPAKKPFKNPLKAKTPEVEDDDCDALFGMFGVDDLDLDLPVLPVKRPASKTKSKEAAQSEDRTSSFSLPAGFEEAITSRMFSKLGRPAADKLESSQKQDSLHTLNEPRSQPDQEGDSPKPSPGADGKTQLSSMRNLSADNETMAADGKTAAHENPSKTDQQAGLPAPSIAGRDHKRPTQQTPKASEEKVELPDDKRQSLKIEGRFQKLHQDAASMLQSSNIENHQVMPDISASELDTERENMQGKEFLSDSKEHVEANHISTALDDSTRGGEVGGENCGIAAGHGEQADPPVQEDDFQETVQHALEMQPDNSAVAPDRSHIASALGQGHAANAFAARLSAIQKSAMDLKHILQPGMTDSSIPSSFRPNQELTSSLEQTSGQQPDCLKSLQSQANSDPEKFPRSLDEKPQSIHLCSETDGRPSALDSNKIQHLAEGATVKDREQGQEILEGAEGAEQNSDLTEVKPSILSLPADMDCEYSRSDQYNITPSRASGTITPPRRASLGEERQPRHQSGCQEFLFKRNVAICADTPSKPAQVSEQQRNSRGSEKPESVEKQQKRHGVERQRLTKTTPERPGKHARDTEHEMTNSPKIVKIASPEENASPESLKRLLCCGAEQNASMPQGQLQSGILLSPKSAENIGQGVDRSSQDIVLEPKEATTRAFVEDESTLCKSLQRLLPQAPQKGFALAYSPPKPNKAKTSFVADSTGQTMSIGAEISDKKGKAQPSLALLSPTSKAPDSVTKASGRPSFSFPLLQPSTVEAGLSQKSSPETSSFEVQHHANPDQSNFSDTRQVPEQQQPGVADSMGSFGSQIQVPSSPRPLVQDSPLPAVSSRASRLPFSMGRAPLQCLRGHATERPIVTASFKNSGNVKKTSDVRQQTHNGSFFSKGTASRPEDSTQPISTTKHPARMQAAESLYIHPCNLGSPAIHTTSHQKSDALPSQTQGLYPSESTTISSFSEPDFRALLAECEKDMEKTMASTQVINDMDARLAKTKMELDDMLNQTLELRVKTAITGNRLIRLDNPIVFSRMDQLCQSMNDLMSQSND